MIRFSKLSLGLYCAWFFFSLLSIAFTGAFTGAFAAETPAAYENAKNEFASLSGDERRSQYRHEWMKCADLFWQVYEQNPGWANRPAALFRSADALEEMARRSLIRKDAQDAAARFELLVARHPDSVLADDALYRAALIRTELMRDPQDSIALLEQLIADYSNSDFFEAAQSYLGKLNGSAPSPIFPDTLPLPAEDLTRITEVNAIVSDNGLVRLSIAAEQALDWQVSYQEAEPERNLPQRLILDLQACTPERNLSLGELYSDLGILTRYAFDFTCDSGNSRLIFDFSDLYRYAVRTEQAPFQIIIEATNLPDTLPGAQEGGITVRDELVPVPDPVKPQGLADNLIDLLGLQVQRIIIDPGHGGKDPGASHNGLVEREVVLDIAKRLAAILTEAGYEAILTRDDDFFLTLTERADLAVARHGDLLISIHLNANNNPDVHGLETYYLDLAGTTEAERLAAVENQGSLRGMGELESLLTDILLSARRTESRRLASQVQERMLSALRSHDFSPRNGGVKGAPFHVLMGTSMPGILVEIGYSSNVNEASLLKQDAYRQALAQGIAEGIYSYSNQLRTVAQD